MSPSLRRDLAYPLAVVACLMVGALAVGEILLTARYGAYTALTSLMDKRQPVSAAAIINYAQRLSQLPETCRTDLLNAAVTVDMRGVDQLENSGDQVAWIASLRSLEPRLRHALTCSPTDGLLWERLAVVRWFLGGTAKEQTLLMGMSQAYSPGELGTLRSRMEHWKRLSPAVIEQSQDALRADVRVILHHSPPQFAKKVLAEVPQVLTSIVITEAAMIPEDRRSKLRKVGVLLD
jgi:hypothetical protein